MSCTKAPNIYKQIKLEKFYKENDVTSLECYLSDIELSEKVSIFVLNSRMDLFENQLKERKAVLNPGAYQQPSNSQEYYSLCFYSRVRTRLEKKVEKEFSKKQDIESGSGSYWDKQEEVYKRLRNALDQDALFRQQDPNCPLLNFTRNDLCELDLTKRKAACVAKIVFISFLGTGITTAAYAFLAPTSPPAVALFLALNLTTL